MMDKVTDYKFWVQENLDQYIYLEGMEECFIMEPLRTEWQGKFRNILSDGAQSKDQLHKGGGHTDASKRRVNMKSSIGRREISQLYKQEDRKSVENYGRADDIVSSMKDSLREDQCQKRPRCICKEGMFNSHINGEIHPSTDKS